MKLSLKNRISFHFISATALIIAVVFCTIYFIVYQTVYKNIDNDLFFEANKHTKEILFTENGIKFINKEEWEEKEHREVQVNPVFIQLNDKDGNLMDKSPNLKENELPFKKTLKYGDHFNTNLNDRHVRQVQIPVEENGNIKGYIVAAMSLDGTINVLKNLRNILLILFPIILIALFFISSFMAGKSIVPLKAITNKANQITKNNLNERLDLPSNKDELFDLANSINLLLDRLENAIQREKQFTSDASHELRTPISVIKGTLEVLNRKDRTVNEYKEKVSICIQELNQMSELVEQLLLLARFDNDSNVNSEANTSIQEVIQECIDQNKKMILEKRLTLNIINENSKAELPINRFYAQLILGNIINNAIKYSRLDGKVEIVVKGCSDKISLIISDNGCGIKKDDLPNIFMPFFRSNALAQKEIKGVGLGLSIVQKAVHGLNGEINFSSQFGLGTKVEVSLPKS